MYLRAFTLALLVSSTALAGAKLKVSDDAELELVSALHLWTNYTVGAQAGDAETPLAPVDDRADVFIRRGRFGVKGSILKGHTFNVSFAFDGIGKDQHNGIRAGANKDNLQFYVWDALWTVALHPTWLHVTAGLFRPQVGRESITAWSNVLSLEKSTLQTYMRGHMVGRSNGRDTGINAGGLHLGDGWSLNYNVGAFDTDHAAVAGEQERRWSPLVTARVALSLGDPELEKYALSYTQNYAGARHGVTLALNGSTQGRTDVFDRNSLGGADLLVNWGPFTLVGELDLLARTAAGASTLSRVWMVRTGWLFPLGEGQGIEPSATFTDYRGDDGAALSGHDRLAELSVNWYVRRNTLKLTGGVMYGSGEGKSDYTDGKKFVRGSYGGVALTYLY